ncbi:unnamed protein product [Lota lota]
MKPCALVSAQSFCRLSWIKRQIENDDSGDSPEDKYRGDVTNGMQPRRTPCVQSASGQRSMMDFVVVVVVASAPGGLMFRTPGFRRRAEPSTDHHLEGSWLEER